MFPTKEKPCVCKIIEINNSYRHKTNKTWANPYGSVFDCFYDWSDEFKFKVGDEISVYYDDRDVFYAELVPVLVTELKIKSEVICTCDIHALMRAGCKCGAFKAEQKKAV